MNNKRWDAIWVNGAIAAMVDGYEVINDAVIAIKDSKIAWIGKKIDLPGLPEQLAEKVIDVEGRLITPGLIDCHTHLVFAGDRCGEFIDRLGGKTYAEIAKAGGGIQKTVAETRSASADLLFEQSLPRVEALINEGVTTLEIKSGYGLDLATELKMLRVAKQMGEVLPVNVKRTFLGAHTVPKEYAGRADAYIDYVCNEMLPAIAEDNLAQAVDVFCETISFNLQQTERLFRAAKQYQLGIKCHAEQLSYSGSARLAADYKALSVDHLEYLNSEDVNILAKANTVAVLLPGAFYFLQEKQCPPVNALRKASVSMAIATDCNPGTSPVTSLLLMMNMACVLFKLTPEEAWLGVTRHAAKALGMEASHGTLAVGKMADFVVWNAKHPAELVYFVGLYKPYQRVFGGQ